MSKQHRVKCWPEYFEPLARGEKTAELRLDDRGYAVGDTFGACEWEPMTGRYTGRESWHMITHITRGGPWLADGYAMLSLRPVADPVPLTETQRAQLSAELAACRAEAARLRVVARPDVIAAQAEAARLRGELETVAWLIEMIEDQEADAMRDNKERGYLRAKAALAAPVPNAAHGAALLAVVEAARAFHDAEMDATAQHVIDPNNDEAARRDWQRIAAARVRLDTAVTALARRDAALAADGRDHSARATLARLPVINDPVISEAVRSLDDE